MSLSRQHALTLPATPRAVKLARDWVGRVLTELGREDLALSAELGVSELVTNAIMHSTPPVAVRVRGTQAHPRIEVADQSLEPPRPLGPTPEPDGDGALLTFGRGLALVARYSACWGSDIDALGPGKTVWFEPIDQPRDGVEPLEGDLFDLNQLVAGRSAEAVDAAEASDIVEIRLLATPVTAMTDVRRKYHELRRELRLLALADPEGYPLAIEFSTAALQAEVELRRFRAFEVLLDAEHQGAQQLDLVFTVPTTLSATIGRLIDLLDRVYAFFDEEQLLTTAPNRRQRDVQAWYLGELVRQASGAEPLPWPGGYRDHRGAQTAS